MAKNKQPVTVASLAEVEKAVRVHKRETISQEELKRIIEHNPMSGCRKMPIQDIDSLDRQERYDLFGY